MIVQSMRSRDLRDVVERGVVEHGRPAMTVVVLFFFSFHIETRIYRIYRFFMREGAFSKAAASAASS